VKIFILGAEGAGKTVFVAMLSRYLAVHHRDVVLEPATFETSKYIVLAQATLERNEWPASTRMGQAVMLCWNLGRVGGPLHQMLLYDAAGQDLRSLLLMEDLEAAPSQTTQQTEMAVGDHLDGLRAQVNAADVLVYLLDLDGLIGAGTAEMQNENCWLLKSFLVNPKWQGKKRFVVLTKKDKYEALLSQYKNDVRRCIEAHLPMYYSTTHWLAPRPGVHYAAISSVATETVLGVDGTPYRRPRSPFSPGDMVGFTQFLRDTVIARGSVAGLPLWITFTALMLPPFIKAFLQDHSMDIGPQVFTDTFWWCGTIGFLIVYFACGRDPHWLTYGLLFGFFLSTLFVVGIWLPTVLRMEPVVAGLLLTTCLSWLLYAATPAIHRICGGSRSASQRHRSFWLSPTRIASSDSSDT